MLYKYLFYYDLPVIYSTTSLTIRYHRNIFNLDTVIVPYYGRYIHSFGTSFHFITHDDILHSYYLETCNYVKCKLHDIPDDIYPTYHSCILRYGHIYMLYSRDDTITQLHLPIDMEYVSFGSHYVYYSIDGITLMTKCFNVNRNEDDIITVLPYPIKELYSLNITCVVRCDNDRYYMMPSRDHTEYNIMGKYYVPTVMTEICKLRDMNIKDMRLFNNIKITTYDNMTYLDNSRYVGEYTMNYRSQTLNLERLEYVPDMRKHVRKYSHKLHDIIIICSINGFK